MQFCIQRSSGEATAGRLCALHRSLNTPVIAVADLPVGPARAGIALRQASAGDERLQVAVRALRTGQVVVYAPAPGAGPASDPEAGLEAALSFAEGMGFLFDDDEVAAHGPGGEAAAEVLWRELVEEHAERSPGLAAASEPRAGAVAAAAQAGNPSRVLSKFRFRPAAAGAPPAPFAAATDSRIRLLSRF